MACVPDRIEAWVGGWDGRCDYLVLHKYLFLGHCFWHWQQICGRSRGSPGHLFALFPHDSLYQRVRRHRGIHYELHSSLWPPSHGCQPSLARGLPGTYRPVPPSILHHRHRRRLPCPQLRRRSVRLFRPRPLVVVPWKLRHGVWGCCGQRQGRRSVGCT
jgi:hypothetical protein